MRFQFTQTSHIFRLGMFFVSTGSSEASIDTPGCLLYTRYGNPALVWFQFFKRVCSFPNSRHLWDPGVTTKRGISAHVLYVSSSFRITDLRAHFPLLRAERKSVMRKFRQGVAKFTGLGVSIRFVCHRVYSLSTMLAQMSNFLYWTLLLDRKPYWLFNGTVILNCVLIINQILSMMKGSTIPANLSQYF